MGIKTKIRTLWCKFRFWLENIHYQLLRKTMIKETLLDFKEVGREFNSDDVFCVHINPFFIVVVDEIGYSFDFPTAGDNLRKAENLKVEAAKKPRLKK